MNPRPPRYGEAFPADRLLSVIPFMRGVTSDSRRVTPGMGFAAYPGEAGDGRQWIADALHRGASAILWEPDQFERSPNWGVPDLAVPGLRRHASQIADLVYGEPSAALSVIGVTGTNGKTSTTTWIAQALCAAAVPCGVIGTLGAGMPGSLAATGFTTPGPMEVQQQLAALRSAGAKAVAMEVSSHGLALGRVDGVRFDLAAFTNLTRDHLDFHGSMEAYGAAKTALFHAVGLRCRIINIDDPFGAALHAALVAEGLRAVAVSQTAAPDVAGELLQAQRVRFTPEGTAFLLVAEQGSVVIQTPLVGRFNLSNLLGVLACLLESGVPLKRLPALASALTPPPGRLERIGAPGGVQVVVDYAHTPDALEQLLTALLATLGKGRLICVFGCGGDRDAGKRPEMGAIAERLAHQVIITSDNPRSENPQDILEDIAAGMKRRPLGIEPNRAAAILHAIRMAVPGDLVVIAGKGHETTQEIDGIKYPFSDADYARQALGLPAAGA